MLREASYRHDRKGIDSPPLFFREYRIAKEKPKSEESVMLLRPAVSVRSSSLTPTIKEVPWGNQQISVGQRPRKVESRKRNRRDRRLFHAGSGMRRNQEDR